MPHRVVFPKACPICGSDDPLYEFATSSGAFFNCQKCNLFMCDPTQSQVHHSHAHFWSQDLQAIALSDSEKIEYLDELLRHAPAGRLLEVGSGTGAFLAAAQARGYEVVGYEGNPKQTIQTNITPDVTIIQSKQELTALFEPNSFEVVVLFDILGRFPDPLQVLRDLRRLLKPDGVLLLSLPVLDSPPPQLFRQAWVEFYKGAFFFFDTQNVQNALFKTGFDRSLVVRHQHTTDINWLSNYLMHFRVPGWLAFLLRIVRFLPKQVQQYHFKATGGHAIVISRVRNQPEPPLLSVIVPVYNERATFRTLMDGLIAKEVPGIEKEIVIVESNSTDGTRDEVLAYRDCPGVQVVLQDRPRGKGNAVRTGFQHANGDFILIQDADLEYDLDDYDTLLKPLVTNQQAFVIGSRHSGNNWKMRQFNDAPLLASFFNLGHVIFLTLFNMMYFQRLKDPFSMFKVFRRECLYGLIFECNRFDFDFELMIKLLRKGYRPIRIPVNYTARSFKEGKKVSAWRDPLTWIRALIKFRLQPLMLTIHPLNPGTINRPPEIVKVEQVL